MVQFGMEMSTANAKYGTSLKTDQIRCAVEPDERKEWSAGLQKRNLNGSAILRSVVQSYLKAWREEDIECTVKGADDARDGA